MAGIPAQEVIVLMSSDDDAAGDADEDSSWSDNADGPDGSTSDLEDLFLPVEPAVGDEDEESSSSGDGDVRMASPGAFGIDSNLQTCIDASVVTGSPPAQTTGGLNPPQMPNLPRRQPYVMDHSAASLPVAVNVPVPAAFASIGIHQSGEPVSQP
ncbi:unnamed protein product [Peniophora sp. CBMAI 1063]|nr:unnamed protein product [Peniophora sp. CBMAI 1063]